MGSQEAQAKAAHHTEEGIRADMRRGPRVAAALHPTLDLIRGTGRGTGTARAPLSLLTSRFERYGSPSISRTYTNIITVIKQT